VKALLLAAGRGTRLAPLTDTRPKILAPLAGRSLLEHQLQYLERSGVTELAVNVSYLADDVVTSLNSISSPLRPRVSFEPEPLGTAGALLPLREFFTEPFIVLYGDVVTDANLRELMDVHCRRGGIATLAYYESDETAEKGLLSIERDGKITGFFEKQPDLSPRGNVNAGIYALEPSIVDLVDRERYDFGLHVWPAVLQEGRLMYGHRIHGYVRDVGTLEALAAADDDIRTGVLRW
jgi:NDP-sugar pyrophosphorylase family protein